MSLNYIDEYEHDFPIIDATNNTLKVQRTITPSGEYHIYTVNTNNQLHGLYRVYTQGTIVKEYEYKNGLLDGSCIEWSSYTRYIKKLITYKKGLMHGNYAEYIAVDKIEDNEKVTYLLATTNCTYYNNLIQGPCYKYDVHTGQIKTRHYINSMLCVSPRTGYSNTQIPVEYVYYNNSKSSIHR